MKFYQKRSLIEKKKRYFEIARKRKLKWAIDHQQESQTQFKSHFIENPQNSQQGRTNCNNNKFRNRIAAQQSRQKHKAYVSQLQKKVRLYEQLLFKKGVKCHQCQKNSLLYEQNLSFNEIQLNESLGQNIQQQGSEKIQLDNEFIRVSKDQLTNPYSYFFVLSLICVILIASFNHQKDEQKTDKRLLNAQNHNILSNQQLRNSYMNDLQRIQIQSRYSSFATYIKISQSNSRKEQPQNKLMSGGEIQCQNETEQMSLMNLNLQSNSEEKEKQQKEQSKWINFGDYVCSQNSEMTYTKIPQVLLLKTQREHSPEFKQKMTLNKIKKMDIQREYQISSCFLKEE